MKKILRKGSAAAGNTVRARRAEVQGMPSEQLRAFCSSLVPPWSTHESLGVLPGPPVAICRASLRLRGFSPRNGFVSLHLPGLKLRRCQRGPKQEGIGAGSPSQGAVLQENLPMQVAEHRQSCFLQGWCCRLPYKPSPASPMGACPGCCWVAAHSSSTWVCITRLLHHPSPSALFPLLGHISA